MLVDGWKYRVCGGGGLNDIIFEEGGGGGVYAENVLMGSYTGILVGVLLPLNGLEISVFNFIGVG
jgi:hypothetical protein